MPERTAVFTVRLAPSLIAGLREHARSRGLTLSATVAEAVQAYLAVTSGTVARRVEIEFVSDRLAGARLAQAYGFVVPERRRVTGNGGAKMSDMISEGTATGRVAAIYARVSSERQRQDETIQSQPAGLRELAAQRGLLAPRTSCLRMRGSRARRDAPGARADA